VWVRRPVRDDRVVIYSGPMKLTFLASKAIAKERETIAATSLSLLFGALLIVGYLWWPHPPPPAGVRIINLPSSTLAFLLHHVLAVSILIALGGWVARKMRVMAGSRFVRAKA
jgi:hypothetical protein